MKRDNDTCRSIRTLLVDYVDGEMADGETDAGELVDGELTADAMRRVAAHLATCAACRAEQARLARSLELARSIWNEAAAGAASEELEMGGWGRSAATPPVGPSGGSLRSTPATQLIAASIAAGLLAIGVWAVWDGTVRMAGQDAKPSLPAQQNGNGLANGPAPEAPEHPSQDVPNIGETDFDSAVAFDSTLDLERMITEQVQAARLAAAARILAEEPSLGEYVAKAKRYVSEHYGDTPAGRALADEDLLKKEL